MGYGPVINGKQTPITPWQGSWAQQEQARKLGGLPPLRYTQAWPIGVSIKPSQLQLLEDQKILKDAEYFRPYDNIS